MASSRSPASSTIEATRPPSLTTGRLAASVPEPDQIGDHVQVLANPAARPLGHLASMAVQEDLRPELTKERLPLGAGRGDHPCAPPPGQLHEQAAHPTGSAVDQQPLARPGVQPLQQLHRGGAGQREGGRLNRAEARWPRADQPASSATCSA
jgi:hypothetical protein